MQRVSRGITTYGDDMFTCHRPEVPVPGRGKDSRNRTGPREDVGRAVRTGCRLLRRGCRRWRASGGAPVAQRITAMGENRDGDLPPPSFRGHARIPRASTSAEKAKVATRAGSAACPAARPYLLLHRLSICVSVTTCRAGRRNVSRFVGGSSSNNSPRWVRSCARRSSSGSPSAGKPAASACRVTSTAPLITSP